MKTAETTVITISRLLGSGGSYLGHQIAKRLGYKYADREILRQAALQLGAEEDSLVGRDERISSFWENLLWTFGGVTSPEAYVPPPLRLVDDRELQRTEAGIIRGIASRYDAVIIGRGGAHILQEQPNVVKVFVHAPREFRLRRVMELYNITSVDEARAEMDKADRERKKAARSWFGVYFGDARLYDLCINTEASGFALAEEMVVRLVEQKKRNRSSAE